ncbi:MAG TPA: PEP-CTERM sorting domain-containing protein [Candidatus Acidoferrum sp.]|nr:PEP-CTERM sorting domain-containing protein [Candidatus Acidoferrum sp.]
MIYSTVAAGAPTSFKESFIELDGRVTLFKNSIITLTLQGFADGVLIDSVTETFGPGACGKANSCSKPVFKFMFGGGGTNVMLFTERLTVNITGGGSYKVSGSNPFGSVPEPTTLSLFGTGLLALVGARRRGAGPHFSRKAEITGAYLLRGLKFGKGNSGYGGQANEAIPS